MCKLINKIKMQKVLFGIFFPLTLVFVFPSLLKSQENRQLTQEVEDKRAQKRIALVIGNGAYTKAKALPNPPNDAADTAKALKELGFEVISGVNQDKRQMDCFDPRIRRETINVGGIGLFYYAGHGLQVGGENYLVPVDADIPEEDEVVVFGSFDQLCAVKNGNGEKRFEHHHSRTLANRSL